MIIKKYIHIFLLFFWGTIIVLYLVKPIVNKYNINDSDNKPKLIKKEDEEKKKKNSKKEEEEKKKNSKKNPKKEEEEKKKKNPKKEEEEKKKKQGEEKKKKEEEEKKKKEEEEKKKKEEEEKKKKALTEDDIIENEDLGQTSYGTVDDKALSVNVNINKKNQYDRAAIAIALGLRNDNKRMNEDILKKSGYDEEWYTNIFKLNKSDDDTNIITINNYDNYKNMNL